MKKKMNAEMKRNDLPINVSISLKSLVVGLQEHGPPHLAHVPTQLHSTRLRKQTAMRTGLKLDGNREGCRYRRNLVLVFSISKT